MKHVLLVDDLADALDIVQEAVQTAFAGARCVRARSVREALALTDAPSQDQTFDLALVDLSLGDGHGHEVIARLAQRQPQCAIVVSTIHDDDEHLFQALQAGAQGYLLKDHPVDWLARQLQGFDQGQPPLSPSIARRLLRHFGQQPRAAQAAGAASANPHDLAPDLSAREREVLGLLAQGLRIADISELLAISRHTVGDHVKNIYRKLNVSSRAEAALTARGLGLA